VCGSSRFMCVCVCVCVYVCVCVCVARLGPCSQKSAQKRKDKRTLQKNKIKWICTKKATGQNVLGSTARSRGTETRKGHVNANRTTRWW